MEAQLLNSKGEKVGRVELKEEVFGVKPKAEFLHEYVTIYENNQRQYDAHTKTRSDVSGGGHKPWKQKHTGRARAGSIRSPLWRKGGVIFGPKSGKVRLEMPRRKAQLALAHALAARLKDEGVVFVESLSLFDKGPAKTKVVAAALSKLACAGRTVLVLEQPDAKLALAARNLPGVRIMLAGELNAYEVLRSRKLVVTKGALEKLGARWN